MAINPLVNHAVQNAWCSIDQDSQYVIKPARLTVPTGVRGFAPHLWGHVALPTNMDFYHVYQIGQINPHLLGLLSEPNKWFSAAETMNSENVIIDVYNNHGIQFPRYEVYFQKTVERNLIVAVKDQNTAGNARIDDVFIRVYSNAFFASDRADNYPHRIKHFGARVRDQLHTLEIQREYHTCRSQIGHTWLYHNGRYVQDIQPSRVAPGDSLEFVQDTTVKRVIDFDIKDLEFFTSELDAKQKWLLHYAGEQIGGEIIDYRDDIDVFLIKKGMRNSTVTWNGVYFHKNADDSLRQVTHRDYSITVPYVFAYLNSNPEWLDVNDLTIRLCIRHAGFHRPLINEHHRIKELYKLPDIDIVRALTGVDASVPEWYVAKLENSYYPKLMGLPGIEIGGEDVQNAYGYNACAKILADTPNPVILENGRRVVNLPPTYWKNATAYEYAENGKLLGYHYHSNGRQYTPQYAETVIVEMIAGKGDYSMSAVFGQQTTRLRDDLNYRFYVAAIEQGKLNPKTWKDVTGDSRYYQIVNGTIQWLTHSRLEATCVKSDASFLAYQFDLNYRNGLMRFNIDGEAQYPAGHTHGVLYVAPGNIDLWLNGHSLIENLDYYIQWPEIVIVNKKYRNATGAQTVTVRATGFCNDQMQLIPAKDFNFVRYGKLSRNRRFNVRDDKVQRIIVDGKLLNRYKLKFDEDGSNPQVSEVDNGSPYLVEDCMIPLRDLIAKDPYTFKQESEVIDLKVEDFLSSRIVEPEYDHQDAIVNRYPVFSPLISALIYDMIHGIFPMDDFKNQYSDKAVKTAVQGYLWLLAYDPTQRDLGEQHVVIHPHDSFYELEVDIYQYNFLERVVRLFLKNKVDLSQHVSIKSGWF